MRLGWLLLLASIMTTYCCWAEEVVTAEVMVAPIYSLDNPRSNNHYFARLLQLALDKTVDSHGAYRLQPPSGRWVDNRLRAALANGTVHVAWFTNFAEAERNLLKVEATLLGDINEHRMLLVRSADLEKFRSIETLEQLRLLTAGVGSQWADAQVLKANSLPYVTGPRYDILFRMLRAGRFDYFPRGLYQIKNELDSYAEWGFAIVPDLTLHYPNAIYFFVAKNNAAMAQRIEKGLQLAKADGSFDALQASFAQFNWARQQLQNPSLKRLPLRRF